MFLVASERHCPAPIALGDFECELSFDVRLGSRPDHENGDEGHVKGDADHAEDHRACDRPVTRRKERLQHMILWEEGLCLVSHARVRQRDERERAKGRKRKANRADDPGRVICKEQETERRQRESKDACGVCRLFGDARGSDRHERSRRTETDHQTIRPSEGKEKEKEKTFHQTLHQERRSEKRATQRNGLGSVVRPPLPLLSLFPSFSLVVAIRTPNTHRKKKKKDTKAAPL